MNGEAEVAGKAYRLSSGDIDAFLEDSAIRRLLYDGISPE